MRISTKLVVNTVIIAIFSVIVSTIAIGWMVYANANDFLEELAVQRFVSLRDAKVDQIQEYYSGLKKQVITFARDYTIVTAMQEFTDGFNTYSPQTGETKYNLEVIRKYGEQFASEYASLNDGAIVDFKKLLNVEDDKAFALQYHYILQNPYTLERKSKYNFVQDGTKYSEVHKKFHPFLREYEEKFKFEDILLIDSKTGNVVYSVEKGIDYATSLNKGAFANSLLGEVFRLVNEATEKDLEATDKELYAVTDFKAYIPSYNNVTSFIAAPVFDEGSNKIGILVFQISSDYINSVMTSNGKWEQSGWGKTGETYILGNDSIMRTMSRFFVEDPGAYLQQMTKLGVEEKTLRLIKAKNTTIGLQKISSVGAREVVQGKTGVSYYKDYRKQPVIATYEPLNIPGLNWGVICGIDTIEAFAAVHTLAHKVILYGVMIVLIISTIAIFIGFALSKQVSEPIEKFSNLIYWLAKKQDLTKRIKVNNDDELGHMARALNTLIANLQQACKMTIESSRQIQSTANKLFSMNNPIDSSQNSMDDRAKIAEETEDSLQLLTSRLENLSNQFKIFEEESERTSGW